MEVTIIPDGEGRFIVSCPEQMEWQARMDLVGMVKESVGDKTMRGIVVDLHKTNYINSAGLGAIFGLYKYVSKSGGKIVVARPGPRIARLLHTVNLPALMPVTNDLAEARKLVS